MVVKARPFDFPYDGVLAPAATAVLVIDAQEDFVGAAGYFAQAGHDPTPLRAVLPNIDRVVNHARRAGCRIVWTRQGYRPDLADLTDYDRWRNARSGIAFPPGGAGPLVRGSQGFAIAAGLHPEPSDILVDKTANGAFYQTDLDLVLRAQAITHLLFCGVTTDVCVHTTLREANDRKFQCALIEDACASGEHWAHEAAVRMVMVEGGVFGTVTTTQAVLDGLDADHAALHRVG